MPNGDYTVTLKFAEIYPYIFAGARKFDVSIEGRAVINDFDLLIQAGKNTAYDFIVPIPIQVKDGVLNIDFYSDQSNAKVNAILVTREASIQPR